MKKLFAGSYIATLLLISGCASITSGPEQQVRITSNPPGAVLKIDGKNEGGHANDSSSVEQ